MTPVFRYMPNFETIANYLGLVRLGSIRYNKKHWNNASKRLFGSYSHSGIPGFPFRNAPGIFQTNAPLMESICAIFRCYPKLLHNITSHRPC